MIGVGWLRSSRTGDTGVGKTIEDFLSIPENRSPEADLPEDGIEIKSQRNSCANAAPVTLKSKNPCWPPRGTHLMAARFGWYSEDDVERTGARKFNTNLAVGRQTAFYDHHLGTTTHLTLQQSDVAIEIVSVETKEVHSRWLKDTLSIDMSKKMPNLRYIGCDTALIDTQEFFRPSTEVTYRDFCFERFCAAVQNGKVSLQNRVSNIKVRTHILDAEPRGITIRNRGTVFRILARDLGDIFSQ